MPHHERLNNANTAKIMAETFGRYNIFAISLSLSGANRQSTTFIKLRARARKYTAFLASMQEKSDCFFVPVGRLRRGRRQTLRNNKYLFFIHFKFNN